jgi:RNA polymerase sigma factor (sigma-70 family)
VEDFERWALPHAGAALRLARALVRNDADAEDVVQEAYVRALRHQRGFWGENARAWLLAIVRNASYALLRRNGRVEPCVDLDEAGALASPGWSEPNDAATPEAALIQAADAARVRRALDGLPAEFREVVVLRELEQCSYKEIADIADIPLGTVMSRLSRGRRLLAATLVGPEATTP